MRASLNRPEQSIMRALNGYGAKVYPTRFPIVPNNPVSQLEHTQMSFMKPAIYGPQYGWKVETTHGTEFLPSDVSPVITEVAGETYVGEALEQMVRETHMQDFCEGTIESIEVIHGFFGRYSAPGYLDCTPWSFDTSEETLATELNEMYGEEESE